ncbi:acyltransferase [Bradyrhizobium sp. Arg237L]|uniref:acyltransferase n=1 Tax=Bradyrhizobium sp. Arg237L TaxID=3003352 RepID=UPI00249EEE59|nr:acyltransferase [Bradyrhizobium sp. Arg237L]MDI4238546.1 acyltransferase [Bradyrhizobium sp. Arg237L]
MRGTARKISIPRCFIADLMRASLDIPFVSLTRLLNIRDLVDARAEAARAAGWAAIFVKAFALVAKDEPALRTLYVKWPWPGFYELPRSAATVAIARVVDGEDCVLPQKIGTPEIKPLAEIDALIHHAKEAPVEEVAAFRKALRASGLPLPLRRLLWWIGLNSGRQRANYFGSFSVTSVAAIGPGELHAVTPGPFILSYGVEEDGTISVVLRWDHRITDAALIARTLCRLEQVLNGEIAAELRADRQQTDRVVSGNCDLMALNGTK